MNPRLACFAPIVAVLIAGCALRPLDASSTPVSADATSKPPPSMSAAVAEASVESQPCGVYSEYDYIGGAGSESPDEALEAFLADLRALQPPDARESVIREALLAAGAIATSPDKSRGIVKYEARIGGEVIGTFEVSYWPGDEIRYVVSSTWVPVPEEFCSVEAR